MNAFDIAQSVNDRLNGGDEGKFPVTLAIVSELSFSYKNINGSFEHSFHIILSGDEDEIIMRMINQFNDEDELKMQGKIQAYIRDFQYLFRDNENGIVFTPPRTPSVLTLMVLLVEVLIRYAMERGRQVYRRYTYISWEEK